MIKFTFNPFIAFASLLILAGCVTPIPHGPASDIAVDQVRATPPDAPQTIRWGGTITSVDNLEDGRTTIEIVSRPLATNGRPLHNDNTDGRFIAEVDEVIDPAIIKAGRDVTVIGLVGEELRDGIIGKSPYAFPVVDVDDYHFWDPSKKYERSYCYDCGYGYGYGFYSHGYRPYGYRSRFHIGYHHYYGFGRHNLFRGNRRHRGSRNGVRRQRN